MSKLGIHTDGYGPLVLLFISSFCSKCMVTREILHRYFDPSDVRLVNIATSDPYLQDIRPSTVPTISILDDSGTVIYYREDIISDQEARRLHRFWNKLAGTNNGDL